MTTPAPQCASLFRYTVSLHSKRIREIDEDFQVAKYCWDYFELSFKVAKVVNLDTNLGGYFLLIMFHNGRMDNLDLRLGVSLLYIL
jgi:hypothetical protein